MNPAPVEPSAGNGKNCRAASPAAAAAGSETPPSPASLPVRAADGLLWLYQKTLSPALAALAPTCGCRFAPTCSHYAREAVQEHGLLTGVGLTARRLVKCGPWHPGGFDPVPPSPRRWQTNSPAPSLPDPLASP